MPEADTCRTPIPPKLPAAGWESEPHSIAEQTFATQEEIDKFGHLIEGRTDQRRTVYDPGALPQP